MPGDREQRSASPAQQGNAAAADSKHHGRRTATHEWTELRDRVVVVTGAARGIGAATALCLVACGARVVAVDRRLEELKRTLAAAPEDSVALVRADAADEREMTRTISLCRKRFRRLDGFVANAAIRSSGTAEEITSELWDEVLRVNLSSVYLGARCAVPLMRETGGGSFVAVSSQVGLVGMRRNIAYCAAKGGTINLIRALALDHCDDNIRFNCVCPGPVATAGLDEALAKTGVDAEQLLPKIPLKRLGAPAEVANIILFLLSSRTAFTTGAAWVVDGGYTAE